MAGAGAAAPRRVREWELEQQIGTGSFAVVWRARHCASGKAAAVKEIHTGRLSKKLLESLESEVVALRRTNSAHTVRLLELVREPERGVLYLVLEFCAGGDLSQYIKRRGRVTEPVARHFMRQLGAGLQALRVNNYVHRDLKPQNLLLSADSADAHLKIADFGFARSLQTQDLAETLCGSPLYMAPEILQFQKYDAKADLWSVGTILYELLVGRPPFGGANHIQLLRNIEKSRAKLPPDVASGLSEPCRDLVYRLLRRNPVERLSFEEFFKHPFLALDSAPQPGPMPSTPEPDACGPMAAAEDSLMRSSGTSGGSTSRSGAKSSSSGNRSGDDSLPFMLDDDVPASPRSRMPPSGPPVVARAVAAASPRNPAVPLRRHTLAGGGPLQHPLLSAPQHNASSDSLDDYVLVDAPQQGALDLAPGLATSPNGRPYSRSFDTGGGRWPLNYQHQVPPPPPPFHPGSLPFGPAQLHASKPPLRMGAAQSALPLVTASASRASPPAMGFSPPKSPEERLRCMAESAAVLREVAEERFGAGEHVEALSLHMLALSALKASLEDLEQLGDEAAAVAFDGEDVQAKRTALRESFAAAVAAAGDVAKELGNQEANDGGDAGAQQVPDALELAYQAALSFARTGAVEEVMQNFANSVAAYMKASIVFAFLLSDGPRTIVEQPLVLSPTDRQRLRRYSQAVTARCGVCSAALHEASGPVPANASPNN